MTIASPYVSRSLLTLGHQDTSTHFRFLAAVCSRKRTIVQNGVMGADSDEPVACMTDALKAVMMLSDIGTLAHNVLYVTQYRHR